VNNLAKQIEVWFLGALSERSFARMRDVEIANVVEAVASHFVPVTADEVVKRVAAKAGIPNYEGLVKEVLEALGPAYVVQL
jgi:hypothetical protein